MFAQKTTLHSKLSLGLFIAVNFLFSIKYLSRYTAYYLLFAIGLSFVYLAVWRLSSSFSAFGSLNKIFQPAAFLALIVLSYFLFERLPPEALNVDRWSVITSFWDSYFRGEYVYLAKSHLGNPPGPMPVYFLIALPFYLFGEIGYMTLLGPAVFLLLLKYEKAELGVQNASLLLLVFSTFFVWEVAARSALFLNSSLVLFAILYFLRFLRNRAKYGLFVSALAMGLCMSTRNVYVIPFVIVVIFGLRKRTFSISNLFLLGIGALAVFVVSFIPFVVGHYDEFLLMNPFIVQGTHLIPFSYVMVFVALSFAAGAVARTEAEIHLFAGLILFSVVVSHFYYKFAGSEAGVNELVLGNIADVSYFVLGTPFLLFQAFSTERRARRIPGTAD